MEKCICAKHLCARSESPWFVFGAYFFALLPLAIVYVLDFITEKWKTIRATRREGCCHFLITLVCLPFLLYFIRLQSCIGNYTEMGATMTAVILSALHMARTLWGLAQLQAFKRWNVDALYALTRIGYPAPVGGSEDKHRTRLTRKECSETIESLMVVNNTLIDNAFFSAELPIRLDRNGRLYATRPEETAVRWLVAFLSRFGSKWVAQRPQFDDCAFASFVFHGIRAALHVTRHENGQRMSALPPNHPFVSDRSIFGMYKSPYTVEANSSLPLNYSCYHAKSSLQFRKYDATIREAIFSFDKRSVLELPDDERIAVGKINPEHLKCFVRIMDCSNLGEIQFENGTVCDSPEDISTLEERFQEESAALKRFISQLGFPSASKILIKRFVGVLPIRKNILDCALWDTHTDLSDRMRHKFLQSSLHLDNYIALRHTEFDDDFREWCFFGCVLETVRTLLQTEKRNVDWTPSIARRKSMCSIPISGQLGEVISKGKTTFSPDVSIRLLSEVQSGLVERIMNAEQQNVSDLAAMPETMMLMILGFPDLQITSSGLAVEHDGADSRVLADETMVYFIPQDGGQRELYLDCTLDSASECATLSIAGVSVFDWFLWKCSALKKMHSLCMHRLWTVSNQNAQYLEATALVGEVSGRSMMPWAPFFNVGLEYEEGKSLQPAKRPTKKYRSGGRRQGRAPAALARAKAWGRMRVSPAVRSVESRRKVSSLHTSYKAKYAAAINRAKAMDWNASSM